MLDQNIAREVLACAVRTGGDFAEIFMEDRVDHTILMRSGRIETVNTGRIHGAGIRVFNGTNAIYVHTNDTSRAGLMACAEQAAAAVKGGAGCTLEAFKPWNAARPEEIRILPGEVKAALKAEKVRAAEAAARAVSPEIVQVTANYTDSVQDVLICNTEGTFVADRRVWTRMGVGAVASNGKEIQTGFEGPGAMMGFEIFDERIDPAKYGEIAAKQAHTMLHAPLCPAGIMPVVIDNGFGGVIFHEACGHSLEATSVAFGVSEFSGKLGQTIAAPCVTAIDDGTMVNEWGSLHVDDEGMPTTNLTLIENGVLKNYMIDKLGGRRMNMAPTGSGRRQSYAWAPTSRMRNTYIAAGNDDEAEMIATMGNGLYAKKMGGGSVNPATGEFNFAVNEGYLVKDGKIAHPVRGASLIGRGSEVLLKIDRVGKDMQMGQGMCGSSSGSVPTNVGQPMIRVSSLTVGGQG
ncbi:MAG: TldD/PmbA family protein [Clostridia bacterium]|nr:TldD/PmbA family protein [Clostridia bacterium]